jgi:hypothetical protein
MNLTTTPDFRSIAIPAAAILAALTLGSDARDPEVRVRVFPEKARVSTTLPPADGTPHSLSTLRTLLESSTDLATWRPEGEEITTAPNQPRQTCQDILQPGPRRFFRVRITDTPAFLASGGADVFGYTTALAERLAVNSDITPGNFAAGYPAGPSLPGVSFDVTTAQYYPEWNADPEVWNAAQPPGSPNLRLTDFRLDPASQQKLLTNGFVVSEARGAVSFTLPNHEVARHHRFQN